MLIMIHGYGGSPAELEPVRRLIAPKVEVKTPTLLGHGGRPMARIGGYDRYFDDLAKQIGRREPVFVLGYSLGGYFALAFACRYPERVRGVITLGTQYRFDAAALAYLRDRLRPERLFGEAGERRGELEQRFGAAITTERFARPAAMFQRLHDNPPLKDEDLRGLQNPALVVSGERDPMAPGAEARALTALLPNARLALLPGRAHPIATVPPAPVAREVLRFMAEVEAGAFEAGPPIDLGETLVSGGLPQPDLQVTVRRKPD